MKATTLILNRTLQISFSLDGYSEIARFLLIMQEYVFANM